MYAVGNSPGMLNHVMAGMNIGEIARLSYISRKFEHIKSMPSAQEVHAVGEIQAVMLESAMLRTYLVGKKMISEFRDMGWGLSRRFKDERHGSELLVLVRKKGGGETDSTVRME